MFKDIMLYKFWRIARARTTEELQLALNELSNREYLKEGYVNTVNWFGKQIIASN